MRKFYIELNFRSSGDEQNVAMSCVLARHWK